MSQQTLLAPPLKTNVLGIGVSRTNYQECTDFIIQCAKLQQCCTVAATNVHSITTGYLEPKGHGYVLRHFTLVTPDGQPIRWALNLLGKPGEEKLRDRVRGPQLMLDVCQRAATENISVFLYGSTEKVLADLQINLKQRFPQLKIAGAISPPFRPLSFEEDAVYMEQIHNSGARIILVSLGCPRQEAWAFEHRQVLPYPLLCVGAAFDFYAGNVPEAPEWMQKVGLEWFYRLYKEPRRLWKRYVLLNPLYLLLLSLQLLHLLPVDKYHE
jgi:N-acetylglucosaminyldiphosphoundecaprenol N-acetyl-beta-D-mannosaminyltransferase